MEKQALFENVKRKSSKFEEDQQTQEKETAKKL